MTEEERTEEAQELEETGQPGQAEEAEEPSVNLDEFEDFRKFKSKMDQRQATLEQQLRQQREAAEELQQQLQEERLRDLDPARRAEVLEGELKTLRAKTRVQEEQAQQQARLTRKATDLLRQHGISWDDPRLDTEGGASRDGYERLQQSVIGILAERATKAAQSPQEREIEEKRERAQEQVKQKAGKTSSAKAGPSPEARTAFLEARKSFIHSGQTWKYADWKREQVEQYGQEQVESWLAS